MNSFEIFVSFNLTFCIHALNSSTLKWTKNWKRFARSDREIWFLHFSSIFRHFAKRYLKTVLWLKLLNIKLSCHRAKSSPTLNLICCWFNSESEWISERRGMRIWLKRRKWKKLRQLKDEYAGFNKVFRKWLSLKDCC
jgi:hypothetical protein